MNVRNKKLKKEVSLKKNIRSSDITLNWKDICITDITKLCEMAKLNFEVIRR